MMCRISGPNGELVIFILSNDIDDCFKIGDVEGVQIGSFAAVRQTFEGQNGNNSAPRHADSILCFVNAIFLTL